MTQNIAVEVTNGFYELHQALNARCFINFTSDANGLDLDSPELAEEKWQNHITRESCRLCSTCGLPMFVRPGEVLMFEGRKVLHGIQYLIFSATPRRIGLAKDRFEHTYFAFGLNVYTLLQPVEYVTETLPSI